MSKGRGDDQEGSFLAEKMLNDARSDAFEQYEISLRISTLPTLHTFNRKAFTRDLFSLVIRPLADTSNEN